MKSILLFVLMMSMTGYTYAQLTIKGQITDTEENQPIPGVNILEKGTNNGTTSDVNGQYELTLLDGDGGILVYSFIGFKQQEKSIDKTAQMDVSLEAQAQELDEIVVTALGIERDRKALGYAVQKIDPQEFTEVRQTNLVNALAGRVAGVHTTNGGSGVGSSSRIVIRGESSLSGGNQPLFVVDGIPISNELISNATENLENDFQEVDYGNGAAELSPDDIASINVLKGPAASALYGSRAANGVVVIETKDGAYDKRKGSNGFGVTYNTSITADSPLLLPKYQNEYGQGAGGLFAYEDGVDAGVNDGGIVSFGPKLEGQSIPQFDSPSTDIDGNVIRAGDVIARQGNPITPTPFIANPDNIKNFFQTGFTFHNNIALSAYNDQGNFRLSFSRLNNQGITPNTDLKRNGLSLSSRYKLTNKLTARAYANYINSSSSNRPGIGYGSENAMYLFTWMGRQADTEQLKDYWQAGQENFQQFNYNYKWMDNPYLTMFENTNSFNKHRLIGNLALNYQFNYHWRLRLRSGMDYYNDLRASKRAFSTQRFKNGAYREDEVLFQENNTDVLLSYRNDWHRPLQINASIGGNIMNQHSDYESTVAGELSVPAIYNFGNTKIPLVIQQAIADKRIYSLYAFTNLSYESLVDLDLTFRNDWSSTLPKENNSFAYFSSALGLNLTNLLSLPESISFAKLRLSFASVGNDTDPFQLRNTFVFNENYGSNPLVTNSSRLLNANLRPERLNAWEAGGEFWLFDDRLALDLTVYQNTSTDQIINLPASAAGGYPERVVNGGKIRSRGLEAVLNIVPIQTDAFKWTSFFNFSRNVSRVLELPEGIEQYVTGYARVYSSTDNTVFFIATPTGSDATTGGLMGDMYGTGLMEVDGQQVFDANGFPVRSPELRKLGNYNPDFILGFGNEIKVQNFKLNFLFDWHQGGEVVSRMFAIGSTSGVLASTLPGREEGIIGAGLTDAGDGTFVENTTVISAAEYYNQYYNRANEENAVFDASYLKLRSVGLSYDFDRDWLRNMGLQDLSLGLIANNVLLFTENDLFDPETTTMQGRNFAFGVEDMAYPSTRSVGVNLKVKF